MSKFQSKQCLYTIFVKLLIESVKIAFGERLESATHWKDEKHTRDHLQACNRKGERSNGQLSDLIPTRNGATQGCPLSPLLSLFISEMHSQTAKLRRVHWSNTWHTSSQLSTVGYQTIVVNLAYRLMTKEMVFTNSVSRQDIQPLILNNKQFETIKEFTRTWQCKQRKSYTFYERHC